jgi:hypothetical protein
LDRYDKSRESLAARGVCLYASEWGAMVTEEA